VETKLIEATHGISGPGNWGKFCVARFTTEWDRRTRVGHTTELAAHADSPQPLLPACGWGRGSGHVWVMDLQTGEGAYFRPGGHAPADLAKHRIWVCPLFEPFLCWLYKQDLTDLATLPDVVELPDAPFAFHGYRRSGPTVQDSSNVTVGAAEYDECPWTG
jgi:hypothetical protein